MQRDAAMLEPWLRRMEPLIFVGPEGAGKNLLLSKLFAGQRGTQVRRVSACVPSSAWAQQRHEHNNNGTGTTTTAWARLARAKNKGDE